MNKIYLGNAFGWDTERTAKVAISQLRDEGIIHVGGCAKAQLIKNESFRWMSNVLKVLGYVPALHIVAGIVAIVNPEGSRGCSPNHNANWRWRGVAMIVGGPLLFIADLIQHLFDLRAVNQYNQAHPNAMQAFDVAHRHNKPPYAGHPVWCIPD
jgi:hypothetical protein